MHAWCTTIYHQAGAHFANACTVLTPACFVYVQTPMQRWWRCRRGRCWSRTGTCARSAGRGSSASRTCRCTGGGTRCRGGSWSGRRRLLLLAARTVQQVAVAALIAAARREAAAPPGSACSCARSRAASTTTPPTRWATWWASRSTSGASTAGGGSGCAPAAPRDTPCSPTTRHTSRPAAPAAIPATVAASSQGIYPHSTSSDRSFPLN